jgi:hypothetical protein
VSFDSVIKLAKIKSLQLANSNLLSQQDYAELQTLAHSCKIGYKNESSSCNMQCAHERVPVVIDSTEISNNVRLREAVIPSCLLHGKGKCKLGESRHVLLYVSDSSGSHRTKPRYLNREHALIVINIHSIVNPVHIGIEVSGKSSMRGGVTFRRKCCWIVESSK